MSGGSIYRCPECARLVIYGQTCTCGRRSSDALILPAPTLADGLHLLPGLVAERVGRAS